MNNMKKYSISILLLSVVVITKVIAPTIYNASELNETKIENSSIDNKLIQNNAKSYSTLNRELSQSEELTEISLNNLSCTVVHKQLNIDQFHHQYVQKHYNYNKSRTINVGAICRFKLMKVTANSEVTNQLYEVPIIESNLIQLCMYENIVFRDIVKNKFKRFDSINIIGYSRARDGPKGIDYKFNQGRRL